MTHDPQPRTFKNAQELALAYDYAAKAVNTYFDRHDEGNFHVVLGDGNYDRGLILADWRDLKEAERNVKTASRFRFYPDPEGLTWIEAMLGLPLLSIESAMHDHAFRNSEHPMRPGLCLGYEQYGDTFYADNAVCPRCGTYQELATPVRLWTNYGHDEHDPPYCTHSVCEGHAPLNLSPAEWSVKIPDDADVTNLMELADPTH